MSTESPALELDGVSVHYGSIQALREISLIVPAGSAVALLGPNGAGKSTTLRAIAGLVKTSHGQIYANGRRIDHRSTHAIARSGVVLVPEGRGIFPSLTVRENLEMASFALHIDVDPVEFATADFPVLGQRLKQLAGSLSGGEQQMLSLSRALMTKPSLLMVDEISMGLAPLVVARLFDALAQRRAAGTNLLLVEQYVSGALEIADYVYVMDKGEILTVGEPADVRHSGLISAYLGG